MFDCSFAASRSELRQQQQLFHSEGRILLSAGKKVQQTDFFLFRCNRMLETTTGHLTLEPEGVFK